MAAKLTAMNGPFARRAACVDGLRKKLFACTGLPVDIDRLVEDGDTPGQAF